MSKNLTNKPLKGTSLTANSGVFDTLEVNKIVLPGDTLDGLIDGTQLTGITLIDSEIINTVIGVNGPNEGHFTSLITRSYVLFNSIDFSQSASWDALNGIWYINGGLRVSGCSTLGNLGICENTIRALNSNGDIILLPRQLGSIYLNGPINNTVTSIGNYLTSLNNGNVTFLASDFINLTSKSSSNTFTAFSGQTINTGNGDITLNTDTNIGNKVITSITVTNGNLQITTSTPSSVKIGDTINLSNTSSQPPINGRFLVTNVINSTRFNISTGSTFSGLTSNGTSGILFKPPNNNINLNASLYVKIPENIELTFGDTRNNIYGNTGGIYLESQKDITFNLPGIVNIPQNTKLQFGTTGTNYINFDGNAVNINTFNDLNINGTNGFINLPDIHFQDANPMIANYTQNASDLTDRGIEFRYYEGDGTTGTSKLGWFGWKKSTGNFTFLKDVTNNNEVFTGSPGSFEIGVITIGNLVLSPNSVINANCGSILNVNTITGCGNILNIDASNIVNISTSSRIALQSSGDVYVPHNIPITLGTSGTTIQQNTTGNLQLTSFRNILLNTQTIGSIIVQPNVKISFDGTSIGNQSISSDSNGNFNINSNRNINLITTSGNIIIPHNTSGNSSGFPSIQFGIQTTSETISGSTRGLFFISNSTQGSINQIATSNVNISTSLGNVNINTLNGDILLLATSGNITTGGNVRLYQGSRIIFNTNGTSNSILNNSLGNLIINGPNISPSTGTIGNLIELTNAAIINLKAGNTINIPTNVKVNFDNESSRFIIADTSNNFNITSNSSGTINISSLNTNITNTSGTLNLLNNTTNLVNSSTNITTQNFIITGNTTSTTLVNTENVRLKDPILTLANYTTGSTDGKDRGIEYRYTNTTGSNKLGWFGTKSDTNQFTFYSEAINNNEVITGTLGQMALGNVLIENSLSFISAGNINLNCGTISNANTIIGCGGTINIIANNTTNLSSSNINLISNTSGRVLIPNNVPLAFGNTSNNIKTDSVGNIIITSVNGDGKIILNANVQINGTTENVYSTITNVQDPIFSLGGVDGPISNDFKDRGIEFKWYGTRNDVTGTKVGFFGFDNSTQRFTYIPFATNANEIITGTPGDVEFTNGFFQNLDLNCGTISNLAVINACPNRGLSLVSSSNNINISSSNVILPTDTKLAFGTTNTSISSNTLGNLLISNTNNSSGIIFNTNTNGTSFTQFSQNSPMYFGSLSNGNFMISDTSGNFKVINTSGNIYLSPQNNSTTNSFGSVIIPTNNKLIFGEPETRIESDGTNLKLYGVNISINSTSNITFNGNVDIVGSLSSVDKGQYIYPLGTRQQLNITNIMTSSTFGQVLITTNDLHYLTVSDTVTLTNTTSTPKVNGDYIVTQIIDGFRFSITAPIITIPGTSGIMYGVLKQYQGKDVGIEVDYWSTIGNTSVTAGSVNFKKAFFGWLNDTQQWTYYSNATINNSVVTQGILGDIRANELFANRVNGFILTGPVTAGNNAIAGSNFQISGGAINSTPIGQTTAQAGRFTTLASTVSSSLENVSFQSNLNYSTETYTVNSVIPNRNPVANRIISYVIVSGIGFTGTGNMPLTGLTNGQLKRIVCTSTSFNGKYELIFESGRLITPNPLGGSPPTKITFKRQGQSCELMWNSTQVNATTGAWILTGGNGAYIS